MSCKRLICVLLIFPFLKIIKIKANFLLNLNFLEIGSENRINTIRKVFEALAKRKEEIFILIFNRDTYRANPILHQTGYAISNDDN